MNKTWIAAALMALALLLTGCGGSSGGGSSSGGSSRSADDTKAAKAISAAIVKNEGSSSAGKLVALSKSQADCIGNGMVDKVGTENLQKYKLLDADLNARNDVTSSHLSAADAKATTDVFFSCADVKGLVQQAVAKSTGSTSGKLKTCIDRALNETNLRAFLTATFQGKTVEAQQLLTKPITTCATGG